MVAWRIGRSIHALSPARIRLQRPARTSNLKGHSRRLGHGTNASPVKLEGASRVLDDLDKPVDPLAPRSGELDELHRYEGA
jgi:hypothetical protein